MSLSHEEAVDEVIDKLNSRRDMYGSVLVKGLFRKLNSVWVNVVSKVVPLCAFDVPQAQEWLDYGDFALVKTVVSLDDLVKLVRELPKNGTANIKVGDFDVQVTGNILGDYYEYDSGTGYLDIGWYFERFQYGSPNPERDP